MNRRDFLEKVSDLAKGSAASITLSKVQIAAAAASLTAVACTKENLITASNGFNQATGRKASCYHDHPVNCNGEANGCNTSDPFLCEQAFDCLNSYNCSKTIFTCRSHEYVSGASGKS